MQLQENHGIDVINDVDMDNNDLRMVGIQQKIYLEVNWGLK